MPPPTKNIAAVPAIDKNFMRYGAVSKMPRPGRFAHVRRAVGRGILLTAPYLMKFLSIAGTAAMFLVGGGILTHGVPMIHHWIEAFSKGLGSPLAVIAPTLLDGVAGIIAGAVVLALVAVVQKIWPRREKGNDRKP